MSVSFSAEQRAVFGVVVVAVVIPIILWGSRAYVPGLFSDSYNTLTTITQVSALVGICLFAINSMLSGRYQLADRLFGGLDRVYRVHRWTGISGFVLIVTHVTAVSARSLSLSPQALAQLWLDATNSALALGRLAFVGFVVVILLTLFVKMRYEWLKKMHQTLGLFLLLAGGHVYLIPSDVAINQPLRWYVLGLVGLGLASYAWRTLLKVWLVQRRRMTVTAVRRLNDMVTEVVMQPADGAPFSFIPGQFNFYRFVQPGFPSEDHPFSITAGTNEDGIRISAKALGDFTKRLPELKAGATVLVQGPYGGFSYQRGGRQQVWIAGGIGITPFISMARTLRQTADTEARTIDLFYSVKSVDEAVYQEELAAIADEVPGFSLHLWVTDTRGFLTAADIKKRIDLSARDVYVCGPPGMLAALTKQFRSLGVARHRIHAERFSLL